MEYVSEARIQIWYEIYPKFLYPAFCLLLVFPID